MCAQTAGIDRKTGKTHRQEDGSDIGMEKKIVTQKLEDPTTHQSINQLRRQHKLQQLRRLQSNRLRQQSCQQQLQMQQVEKMPQLQQLPQLSHHQR